MDHAQGAGEEQFRHGVAIGSNVQAVAGHARESQFLRQALPINREGGSRQGSGAHGKFIGADAAIPQAAAIPAEHLEIGQKVMRKQNGLGGLKVRVPGQNHLPSGAAPG